MRAVIDKLGLDRHVTLYTSGGHQITGAVAECADPEMTVTLARVRPIGGEVGPHALSFVTVALAHVVAVAEHRDARGEPEFYLIESGEYGAGPNATPSMKARTVAADKV